MKTPSHGGKRAGAGRPTTIGASARTTITLSPADLTELRGISRNVSEAVRLLLDEHRSRIATPRLGSAAPAAPP